MATRLFTRYQPLSGSARRYVDRHTGHTLSRRAFLGLQGISPERRAFVRRVSGLAPRRKRRADKGQRRPLVWTAARSVPLSNHQAVIVPYRAASPRLVARCFQIFIDHLAIVQAYHLPGRGTRRGRWCCAACQVVVRNKAALFLHALYHHFGAVAASHGPVALTSCLGYIPSHARRAHMPWRVRLPESE